MSNTPSPRRLSTAVRVGAVTIGSGAPVVVQSMTNTDTADAAGTARQVAELARAGSELVRITVNTPDAARAVADIRNRLDQLGVLVVDDEDARGARVHAALNARLDPLDAVGDVRGRGYFIGVELVAGRATREPCDAALGLFRRIRHHTFSRGLICYASGGNVDGYRGDTVILARPYNASDAELDEIADIFVTGLKAALATIGRWQWKDSDGQGDDYLCGGRLRRHAMRSRSWSAVGLATWRGSQSPAKAACEVLFVDGDTLASYAAQLPKVPKIVEIGSRVVRLGSKHSTPRVPFAMGELRKLLEDKA